jgi:hypothetical protein
MDIRKEEKVMQVSIVGRAAVTLEREYPEGVAILNHKGLSDEQLVRAFVEDLNE